jgi:hypothetical protein
MGNAVELRDIAMVKLFFADALDSADARRLLAQIKSRSEERVATLDAIRRGAEDAARAGKTHPLLTLELGIAFHEAMLDVCRRFERSQGGITTDLSATSPGAPEGEATGDQLITGATAPEA